MERIAGNCYSPLHKRVPNWRPIFLSALFLFFFCSVAVFSQSQFDKRRISEVSITFDTGDANTQLSEQYRLIVIDNVGETYSAERIRNAIEALYDTRLIEMITVSATLIGNNDVGLTFTIKRKTQAQRVSVVLGPFQGDNVTEQEIQFRLNLITPGTPITEQLLLNNADLILDHLRDRGFYQSQVSFETRPLQNVNDVAVTFRVTPNQQAQVEAFTLNIEGYDKRFPDNLLRLEPGDYFSYDRLTEDIRRLREHLSKENFIAPELDDPRVTYDSDSNMISISLSGRVGPSVEVIVETESEKIGTSTMNRLLPIRREGTLAYAAIIEGERRLENYYQEKGYFFADVISVCSSTPPLLDTENVPLQNETAQLCSYLSTDTLMGRKVQVKYVANLGRRLRLTDLRIRGTDKITIEDVSTILGSQERSLLAIVPILGYGRGYTSEAILETDADTIESIMAELGYRNASVRVDQGVSIDGEDLIITFVVEEGPPHIVTDVSIVGNTAVPTADLVAQLPIITGQNYSRAKIRNAAQKLSEYYSSEGYFDARVVPSLIEPASTPPDADRVDVKVVFRIENEGRKVGVSRILVDGNENTKDSAILRAVTIEPGQLLSKADIYTSEQNLYSSDAFSRVTITPQPAGDGPDGTRLVDVLVSLEEQPQRLMTYGGGYSTDLGLSGFFDIRHVNLFGKLWQAGARVRMSQKQQLFQVDFVDPRFLRDGKKRFAPLTITAQYQRDETVTRFFRSTFDRGTMGIVQRLDEDGNPIDEFGAPAGSPTINRFGVTAETSKTLSRSLRSILFLRYKFEDVRLYNIESLLVKDLLRPDSSTRISGFGATIVLDTRRNCSIQYSLLDLIAKGEPGEPCRYSASDPTNGSYLIADYNTSVSALGGNIGFQKFQASYNFYHTVAALRNTTFAARGIIGLASVFSGGDRFDNLQFPGLNGLLPISERFFAGGSNNLRGFGFEEAGPRVLIAPQGTFVDSNGDQVFLDPFTIPFGGNGLAVVNLEARMPLSKTIRAVPFYDGGNVFRSVRDIFKRSTVPPNDVAAFNQNARWTHTVGLGLRIKTPVGGEFGVDYGWLLNPPVFLIPQTNGPDAQYRLRQGRLHFRFSQAF